MHDLESTTAEVLRRYGRDALYLVDNAPLYMHRRHLSRILCHYELFKRTVNLPGNIVECGIYRGATLMLWAKLLDIYSMGDTSKKVIGFDTFSGFPTLTDEDQSGTGHAEKRPGGFDAGSAEAELTELITIFDEDRVAPEIKRVEIVKGDICQTAPDYVRSTLTREYPFCIWTWISMNQPSQL